MLKEIPIISIIILIPLLGAIFNVFINKDIAEENSKKVALWTSLVAFILSLYLLCVFDFSTPGFQFVSYLRLNASMGLDYHVGVDGLSLWFIVLTNLISVICILISTHLITHNVRFYMILFLVLQSFLLMAFSALNLIMFFLFFEAVLIPMFFIIGLWGGERRIYAAFKLFLYTMAGSILMLVGIIYLFLQVKSLNYQDILAFDFTFDQQKWLFLAFFLAFAIKTPMWPFHTWLPEAHVQAPTTGSMILAGVLLKLGGYGFLRFMLPFFPQGAEFFTPYIMVISAIGVVYASLIAFAQKDIKKLIAYSSIAHMGVVTLGIFTVTSKGITGAVYQMVGHGLTSVGLFLCAGLLYHRFGSYKIEDYGGLAKIIPVYGIVLMVFTLAGIGLPLSIGFVGEFLILLGTMEIGYVWAAIVALSFVLSAMYMLRLYKKIGWGQMHTPHTQGGYDLKWYESLSAFSLITCIVLLGIWAGPLESIEMAIYPSTITYGGQG